MGRYSNGIQETLRSVSTQRAVQPLSRSENHRTGILHGEIQKIGSLRHRVGSVGYDDSCHLTVFCINLVLPLGQLQPQLRSYFRTGYSSHFLHLKLCVFRKLRNVLNQLLSGNVTIGKVSDGSSGRENTNPRQLLGPGNRTTKQGNQNNHQESGTTVWY